MNTTTLKNNLPLLMGLALAVVLVAWASTELSRRDKTEVDPQPDTSSSAPLAWSDRRDESATVPAGTALELRLGRTLSTESTPAGQTFSARVVEPVIVDGRTVIPANAVVSGTVAEAERSPRIGGRSRLVLEFTSISVNGRARPIDATYVVLGKKQTKRDAATIAGATAGGAVLGRILGHDRGNEAKGTAAGAVVGGAIGTGVALSNRAAHVTLPSGTTLHVQLDSSLTV